MADNLKVQTQKQVFSLVRLRQTCKVPPTVVDFAPLTPNTSILPSFNFDKQATTPAFTIPIDMIHKTISNAQKLRFEQRMRQALRSQELSDEGSFQMEVQQAAPSSNYCQICREHFKNYRQHLEHKSHLLRSTHNQFNEDINKLSSIFSNVSSILPPFQKQKPIKKLRQQILLSPKNTPKTNLCYDSKVKGTLSHIMSSPDISLSKDSLHL